MRKIVILFFLFYLPCEIFSQKSDKDLVMGNNFSKPEFEYKRKVEYLFKEKNWVVKYNPVSLFFGGLMLLYQSTVSVQIGANCPYEVSCSSFSKRSINEYGIFKGIALTADRLTRCTRLAAIDLDEDTDWSIKTHRIIDDPKNYTLK